MANIADLSFGIVVTAPSPATSGTSMTLQSGEGTTFPATPFYATAVPPGNYTNRATAEIVLVTAVSTDTFTIVRNQKTSNGAKSIATGWIVVNGIYKDDVFNSSLTMNEVLTGTPNGSLTAFTTATPFTSVVVYKNGVRMRGGGNDYTATAATGTITFVTAPATGSLLLADYIVGSSLMISGSNSLIAKEAPVETPNGALTLFTVAKSSYIAGSLQVFVNGLRQGLPHVTETSPSSGTFTLDEAPITGANVELAYQYVASVTGNADTVDGIHASATATANQLLALDSNALVPTAALGGVLTSYTPTITGFGTPPTGGLYYYQRIGKMVILNIRQPNLATSNSTGFTITLPVNAVTRTNARWAAPIGATNNGSDITAPGIAIIDSGGTVVTLYPTWTGGNWTASGNKALRDLTIMYESA